MSFYKSFETWTVWQMNIYSPVKKIHHHVSCLTLRRWDGVIFNGIDADELMAKIYFDVRTSKHQPLYHNIALVNTQYTDTSYIPNGHIYLNINIVDLVGRKFYTHFINLTICRHSNLKNKNSIWFDVNHPLMFIKFNGDGRVG